MILVNTPPLSKRSFAVPVTRAGAEAGAGAGVATYSKAFPRLIKLGFTIFFLSCWVPINSAASEKDLLGYELYERDDFGSAAEVFDDTQWRGVALYRSGQWWRAAEAFVRGNEPASFLNLGNTYVKMGYFALALEAYQQALALDPNFTDAEFNADIMKQVIALRENDEEGQGLLQPDSLGEIDQDNESASNSGSPDGGEQTNASDGDTEDPTTVGEQSSSNPALKSEEGSAGQSNEPPNPTPGDEGSSTVTGVETESDNNQNAAGSSDSLSESSEARSSGIRTRVEAEQATEQWLNRIEHNPIEFLKRHIELETRRRQAAGQQAPEGGDGW